MKVIIHEGTKHFRSNKKLPSEESNIIKYIKEHSFYHESLPIEQIVKQIRQKIKKSAQQTNEIKSKLEQLSLYLNNQKNKSIFEIYAIVLKSPNGITYKDIDSKVKIGIVSVSHYCCRLKKMNFVELQHQKNQKVVYPKNTFSERKAEEEDEQKAVKRDPCMSFHFHELSMLDNIWINVSSFESYKANGITNEDIKQKLNKTSETKLIMKMVDQAKAIFNFEKQMVSEGKVFENKFKNVTKEITNISVEEISQQNQTQQKLKPKIENWLKNKFPQYCGQKFLFNFINNELKDYFSVSGVRSARRTCTPIKLTRYIKILNKLNQSWPQTHIQLKNFIIEEEKQSQNGVMHKRSILGILDGLVSKNILKKIEHQREYKQIEDGEKMMDVSNKVETYYYPLWDPDTKQKSRRIMEENRFVETNAKKNKNHLTSLKSEKQVGNKMSLKQYQFELKVRFLQASLEQVYLSRLKKAFKRIFYAKRAKTIIKTYEPETHVFYFLEDQNYKKAPKIKAENYDNFIQQIDQFVENEGVKEEPINSNYEVIKIFRKTDKVNEVELRAKFGNSWAEKIQPMVMGNMLEQRGEGSWILKDKVRYFI